MKNKNGFTLSEILVVIVILGILVAIATPTYLKIRESINEKDLENKKSSILTAAELYLQDDQEEKGFLDLSNISVQELLNNNYIESDKNCPSGYTKCIIDPTTKEVMNARRIKFEQINNRVTASFID